jgi:hypothetical protein
VITNADHKTSKGTSYQRIRFKIKVIQVFYLDFERLKVILKIIIPDGFNGGKFSLSLYGKKTD